MCLIFLLVANRRELCTDDYDTLDSHCAQLPGICNQGMVLKTMDQERRIRQALQDGVGPNRIRVGQVRNSLLSANNALRLPHSLDLFQRVTIDRMHTVVQRLLGRVVLVLNKDILSESGRNVVQAMFREFATHEGMKCPLLSKFHRYAKMTYFTV